MLWNGGTDEEWLHSYYDDLQSFFVLVWVCLKPEAEMREEWQQHRKFAGFAKLALVTEADIFRKMLRSFRDEMREVQSVAWGLKEVLWGSRSKSRDRDTMYNKMLAVIQDGIDKLRRAGYVID